MPSLAKLSLLSFAYVQTQGLPLTLSQFCYPQGTCNPDDLANGINGFSLLGAKNNEGSGHIVDSAGDIDGDGYEEIIIGAPNIATASILYGQKQLGAGGNGKLNLADFMNGQDGFSLQSRNTSDLCGRYVAPAGDVNKDGLSDFLSTCFGADSSAGTTYLTLGSTNRSTWNAVHNISDVNEQHRLLLRGPGPNAYSSWIADDIGDIDGDSIPDVGITQLPLAGMYNQSLYIMFGDQNNNFSFASGQFNASYVDNGRGFVIQGDKKADFLGITLASGNINGDKYSDLIIGGGGALLKGFVLFGAERSFLISGSPWNISNLTNGRTGCLLLGEGPGDTNSMSLATVHNLTGNGLSTILIGSTNAGTLGGKIYGVHGSTNSSTWGNGTLTLVNATSEGKGFILQNAAPGEGCGQDVVDAGDLNGDGLGDFFVQPTFISTKPYKAYALFGSDIWNQSSLYIGNLSNGYTGFALEGSAPSFIKTGIADFNGDKVPDILLGARAIDSFKGQTSVLYGAKSTWAYFSNNTLEIAAEESLILSADNLNVTSTYAGLNASTIVLNFEQVTNGYFSYVSITAPITSCSMQDIKDNKIVFVHNGKAFSPSYRVRFQLGPISFFSDANITFLGYRPSLVSNKISIGQGQTITLTTDNFNAVDQDNNPSALIFEIKNLSNGDFLLDGQNTSRFSLQEVSQRRVSFKHNGSDEAPNYEVAVTDGSSYTPYQAAAVSFDTAPSMDVSPEPIIIDQGTGTLLQPTDLQAKDRETFEANLIIYAQVMGAAYLAYANTPNSSVTQFLQLSLTTANMLLVHPGDTSIPNISFRVYDGALYSNWYTPVFALNHRPTVKNSIPSQTVTQGEAFDFSTPSNVFEDVDANDRLKYSAKLAGGAPLPKEILFTPPGQFSGTSSELGTLNVELTATDLRGLSISAFFSVLTEQSKLDKARPYFTALSSILGSLTAILSYWWLRRRIAMHRAQFPLANDIGETLNLEYYNYTSFNADAYKTLVQTLLVHINNEYNDFYNTLTAEHKKSFAVCLSEMLTKKGYVKESGMGSRIFNALCCLNASHPSELQLDRVEQDLNAIAQEAINAWNTALESKKDVSTHWPFYKPSLGTNICVFFGCKKPLSKNRWFAPSGIELAQLRSHEGQPDVENPQLVKPRSQQQEERIASLEKLALHRASERKSSEAEDVPLLTSANA